MNSNLKKLAALPLARKQIEAAFGDGHVAQAIALTRRIDEQATKEILEEELTSQQCRVSA